tara:strand:+ start:95 stop:379 length:285 start_codon:yes stop_codon:yes gene_type:complete
MFCKKLAVNNILVEKYNNDFYNNYIIETKCSCEYCKFLEKKINYLKNNIETNNKIKSQTVSSFHISYNYSNHLFNIKNNLLKNDLYARKIFSMI